MPGSRSLGTLTVDLIAKVGGFVDGMTKAERQSASSAAKIKRQHAQLAKELDQTYKNMGLIAAGAFAAVSASVKKSLDDMLQMSIAAKQAGLPVDQFTALSAAARRADVDVGTLTTSLQQASKALIAAQTNPHGTQGAAFASLGIDPKQVKDGHDLILKASDALSKYADGTGKTAVEMAIFGRAGAQLNGLLDQNAAAIQKAEEHARKLNVALGPEGAAQLKQYDDAQKDFADTLTGLRNTIAIALLPSLQSATEYLGDLVGSMDSDTVSGFADVFQTLGRSAVAVAGAFETAGKAIGATVAFAASSAKSLSIVANPVALSSALALDPKGTIAGFQETVRAGRSIFSDFTHDVGKDWDKLTQQMMGFGETAAKSSDDWVKQWKKAGALPITRPQLTFNIPKMGGAPKAPKDAADPTDALRDQLVQLTLNAKEYQLYQLAQKGATDGQMAYASSVIDSIDKIKAQVDAQKEADDFLAAHKAAINGVTEAQQGFNDTAAEAIKLLQAHAISTVEFNRVIAEQAEQLNKSYAPAMDEMSEYAKQAARNIQDTFANFLFDPLKDGFDGMVDGFADALRRMAANALAAKIFDSIGAWGKANAGGGGFAGFLGGLASSFGSGHANGGPVSAGGIYPVNERGPELLTVGNRDYLMMGDSSGFVTPHGAGARNTTVNVMVQPTSTRRTAAQVAAETARQLQLAHARA